MNSETTVTLTDDEIVALAIVQESAWPVPLLTVETDTEPLGRAANRGMRSLVARGLVSSGKDAPVIDETIDELITTVLSATSWMAAYATSKTEPGPVMGTATFVFDGPKGAVVDMQTPEGLHGISRTDLVTGRALLIALSRNVFRQGFRGGDEEAVLLLGASGGSVWLAMTKGAVTTGSIGTDGLFVAESNGTDFDAERMEEVLA